jgi:hypothetical protein
LRKRQPRHRTDPAADRNGKDLTWNRCEKWRARANLTFIVGRLPTDTAMFDGDPFWMRQHGFARNTQFFIVGAAHPNASLGSRMTIRRGNNFLWILSLRLPLSLKMRLCVLTRPSSINPHARYRFRSAFTLRPLPYGGSWQEHEIRFEIRADASIHRRAPDTTASTEICEANTKPLDDTMFLSGSLIFD